MKTIYGMDLIKLHKDGHTIGVTINTQLNNKYELVMGKGIALQAKKLYPSLPKKWGENITNMFPTYTYTFYDRVFNLIAIQTKNHWRNPSTIELIKLAVEVLPRICDYWYLENIYLPPLGCGNGQLDWSTQVKPIMEQGLDNRFTVVIK